MLYAILCYDSEAVTTAMSAEEDGALMDRLLAVQEKLAKRGKLGPVARLMPTNTASTLRKGPQTLVLDGPFAETKEQLLGFYVVDCETQEEAVGVASELAKAGTHGTGTYEIRPLMMFKPNAALT
ncbi:Uncharacterized conserved protein [Mesorhizobium albiziae]|uniref:Uncharacterized conserved protein n=1 Tax=Neomesorhizobium albiziae TaxID=335020 RepID=A0A1I4AYP1_9HYPH|nr:YciI family protein [Mesorhizobium albiziae]GLS34175.1 hypothetical protein GCM10007937_58900 [Mesorhizobium albiziae]SFK61270.1 Uncharacterized conserved protein [Mesorhizobium albiziae]